MSYLEFVLLVRKMRAAQKDYFKVRSQRVLLQCKDLERQVDTQIEELTNGKPLFDLDKGQEGKKDMV